MEAADENNEEAVIERQFNNMCFVSPIFESWKEIELLHEFFIKDVIRIINYHKDVSRMYLLNLLFEEKYNFEITVQHVIDKLNSFKVVQPPRVLRLIASLKDMISDVDPIYLDLLAEFFVNKEDMLHELIDKITSNSISYPKLNEYNKLVNFIDDTRKTIWSLTDGFNVENFLTMIPDPVDYFNNVKLNSISTHKLESLTYLSKKFQFPTTIALFGKLNENNFNLTKTVEMLTNIPYPEVVPNERQQDVWSGLNKIQDSLDLEFFKEMAFLDHKDEILTHIETVKTLRKFQLEEAKSTGNLGTCVCCYNDELLLSEIFTCPAGHFFCLPCIKKGVEVAIADNKINFKCFAECDKEFNELLIKKIIDDKLYQRVITLKQAYEIQDASIDGLESCSFCHYSVILTPDMKIIKCLNPECYKETCRACREESHVPLRCDELKQSLEIEVRTMIENKMTEVIVRTCYHCGCKFVKGDGCNKMTCQCGRLMCFICKAPIEDTYQHFYQDVFLENKCPLFIDKEIMDQAIDVMVKLTINELKKKKPKLLEKIDLNTLLLKIKPPGQRHCNSAAKNINQLLAKITGQDVESINNLQDMELLESEAKQVRHEDVTDLDDNKN